MKIQELRIGNIVHYKDSVDEYNTIVSLDNNGTIVIDDIFKSTLRFEDIEGVKVTENDLIKAGFAFNSTCSQYVINISVNINLIVTKVGNVFKIELSHADILVLLFRGELMIHHLQNLYLILTGKELEIKEEKQH